MRFLSVVLLLLLSKGSFATTAPSTALLNKNNEVFITLDQRHGLGQPAVLSMARDNLGYTWVGTQSGLNRFDGYKFSQFNDKGSPLAELAGTYISSLCTTPNNILWVGTRSGLSRYNYQTGQTAVITTANSQISSNKISSLSCGNNKVIAGTYEHGFFSIDSETGKVITDSISAKMQVHDIVQTQHHNYIASSSGLFRQHKDTFAVESSSVTTSIPSPHIKVGFLLPLIIVRCAVTSLTVITNHMNGRPLFIKATIKPLTP